MKILNCNGKDQIHLREYRKLLSEVLEMDSTPIM